MHKILILGPQGSGKGTQANILAEKHGIPALSMGNLLRKEIASGSSLGQIIKKMVDQGDLVPDEVALEVLKGRLAQEDAQQGYILDGYPRNEAQYDTFKSYDEPSVLLVITVPREESMKRLLSRAEKEGRSDDTPEIIQRRLDIYEQDTKPVIEAYEKEGIVTRIDGVGTIEEVAQRIDEALTAK